MCISDNKRRILTIEKEKIPSQTPVWEGIEKFP
jgi:hypothetical protein